MNKLLIICGPTATGKTDLGIRLAKKFNGEIVSADSRQVYRGMDILTGKDLPVNSKFKTKNLKLSFKNKKISIGFRKKDEIPIWLVDIIEPTYRFNVGEYSRLARAVILDILKRGKLPIVVGGTGMYLHAIIKPYDTQTIPPDQKLREILDTLNTESLQNKLEELDSHRLETMNNSDRNNPRRLIRAIEITVHFKRNNKKKVNQEIEYDILKIGLRADLKFLYDRVDIRIHQRIREGAIEEVKNIKDKKASLYSATGIASLSDFIGGKIGLNEAIQKWKMEEHAYIKRQLTWFRKETDIEWFDREEKGYEEKIETVVRTWYTER